MSDSGFMHTLLFSQITRSASQILFCFTVLLYFYEMAVTDVIDHQGAKHYTEMITFTLLVNAALFPTEIEIKKHMLFILSAVSHCSP